MQAAEFHYRIPWQADTLTTGNHAGGRMGAGLEFHSHSPLHSHPDVRHLDLQASLRDPFGQFQVKRFRQSSNLNVVVLADLTASMSSFNKQALLLEVTQAIAWSSYRHGDRFAFYGGAEQVFPDLQVPLSRQYAGLEPLWAALHAHTPQGKTLDGLLACAEQLPAQPSLVFLLSDFHLPLATIQTLLSALAAHDVVPLVFLPVREYQQLPNWRFLRLRDPETGRVRSLFMRPALQQAIAARFLAHRAALQQLFMRAGRPPFFLGEHFIADELTDYFLGGS